MGMTFLSHEQIADVIKVLSSEWQGTAYDLLKLNCCHFCDVFCTRLGVGHIPAWLTHLASAGAAFIEEGRNAEEAFKSMDQRVTQEVLELDPRLAQTVLKIDRDVASCCCGSGPGPWEP